MAISKIKIGSTEHELQTTIANVDGLQDSLDAKAPTSHADSATTYGKGTSSLYGHVKLSDSTSSTSSTTDGIAATPKAVKDAYDLADGKQDKLTFDTTPTSGSTNPVTSGGVYEEFRELHEYVDYYVGGLNSTKQDKLTGTYGYIVGFNNARNADVAPLKFTESPDGVSLYGVNVVTNDYHVTNKKYVDDAIAAAIAAAFANFARAEEVAF